MPAMGESLGQKVMARVGGSIEAAGSASVTVGAQIVLATCSHSCLLLHQPPTANPQRALGTGLLQGPRREQFLASEVPLQARLVIDTLIVLTIPPQLTHRKMAPGWARRRCTVH